MNAFGQTICLSMIVKNEAPVILRCLESVKPIINHWVIVDTGSSDGTQDIIRKCMGDLPGTLYERDWRDFAHNRSEALNLSRPKSDFSLVIDADDFLEYPENFVLPFLKEDAFTLNISDISLLYPRIQIVSNQKNFFYRGVLHEFVTSDNEHTIGQLPIKMVRNHDGARRRDENTYRRDADILEQALTEEQDPFLRARYTFYLAQSYRDCKDQESAIKFYLARAEMGGWLQEVFYSLYQAGKIQERLGYPDQDVIQTYEKATQAFPSRIEARHAASRLCRLRKLYRQGYEIAKAGLHHSYPDESLFGEPWVYKYGLLDEFAVNAYWINSCHECLEACLTILSLGNIPASEYQRIVRNASEAAEIIKKAADAPSMAGDVNSTSI